MKRRTVTLRAVEHLAEGERDHKESEERENAQEMLVAARRSESAAPETGALNAAALQAEGRDNSETQDAARTTAETEAFRAGQSKVEDAMSDVASVLIVEDTIELAEIIQASLERLGLDIAHETHGDRALETFSEMNPDVVLLDIALPDMTGWEVLEHIKGLREETGRIPIIIVITAYGDPANRLIGKFQGVYDYLIKPLTPDKVSEIVTRALNDQGG